MTTAEMLAVLKGENFETVRQRTELRQELEQAAANYVRTPPEEWPSLHLNWDLSAASMHHTLDGIDPDEFQRAYPNGLTLGWVELKELETVLCRANRVPVNQQWRLRDESKLARMVAYVERGLPLTPVLITHLPGTKEICFAGGNHRYAVALAVDAGARIPVYFSPEDEDNLRRMVQIYPGP